MSPLPVPQSHRFGRSPRRRSAIRMAALAAGLALAVPGVASAAEGASVAKDRTCSENPFGTVCVDQHSVWNVVDAASGNVSVLANFRFDSTWTGKGVLAGCVSQGSDRLRSHELMQAGETQQLHFTMSHANRFGCNGSVIDCETTTLYTYANGSVRVDGVRTDCKEA